MVQNNNLFRKKALLSSSSPERLDQVMQVIHPMNWLPLTALGSLVATAAIWSIVGRIPITVTGRGVIIYPSKVMPFQSPATGQLMAMNLRVGEFVKKGQILAIFDQAELQKQLQQQRLRLLELKTQNHSANSLQSLRSELEIKALVQQRFSLQQNFREAQSLAIVLKNRLARLKKLKAQGAISEEMLLQAQQAYQEKQSQINDLQTQLQGLAAREKSLVEQNFQASTTRKNQIQEIVQNIAQLEVQLQKNSQVISPYEGRVLEVTAFPGQVVTQGTRIATIQAEEPSAKLTGLTFFSIGDGKKIQKGMKVQITPSTVERERFGGIMATVTDVSAFPVTKEGVLSVVGNSEVVESLMSQSPQIQVFAELHPDSSTFSEYKWSSSKGPQMKVSSGTTATAKVTVEERSPISFVFPFLKSLTGVN
ncbi:NHLP bacteriocin system secretion protein [Scytonema hofmannii PCC 7110]|uniref:NHLP bacteriocin system secretion protein n=1 Tax=Scytonema hofmannii PCC 7110 TaxID=128403 RepID=A0A139XC90_9CYAN|nr:NHLP bacteriocin system secretion protein [Scytonema hofmannii]KYC42263.1 NHLP bacteriocin system secretion protein [Scytonema hofmannii PCC 7110]